MTERIDSVTIVGGGAAGWIMALFLTTMLNRVKRDRIRITLIESPRIPQIGVGEGTVTGFSRLLKQLDIPEKEFMLKSDASFKCAGRFVGWSVDDKGQPATTLNPFMDGGFLESMETFHYFSAFGGDDRDYLDITQPTSGIVNGGLSPKLIGSKPYESEIPYTYHLNAAAFSEQLAGIAKQRGVEYIQDEMLDAELAEDGSVAALQLEQRGRYPVKFVIDCTGFGSRILQQKLGVEFMDASDSLLVDRAIPMPVPHEDPGHILPCTTATAMEAGWMFNVPLYSRVGTGYIYSSHFKSDDQAWDELKAKLGDRVPKDADPRVIRMKIGRVKQTWHKNCVAAGLSAGFLEPLEATAIYTIEQTARLLTFYFPEFGVKQPVVRQFNAILDDMYQQVLDFIVMMYYTSNRPQAFWQAARNDIVVPESLKERLELWQQELPQLYEVDNRFLFSYWNYFFILWGRGWFRKPPYNSAGMLNKAAWDEFLKRSAAYMPQVQQKLPTHAAYLKSLREAPKPPSSNYSVSYTYSG